MLIKIQFIIFFLFIACSENKNPHQGFTKDRLVFSNQDGNNLHETSLLLDDFKNGKFNKKQYLAGAKFQPLYINFQNKKELSKKFPIFKDKQILFVLKISNRVNNFIEFIALDLESLSEIISIPLGHHVGLSTGIISIKYGKFYFLSRKNNGKKIIVEGRPVWEGANYINSIDLNGENLQRISLDLNTLNETSYSKTYKANLSSYFILCKTALNGEFKADNYITFGCSNGAFYSMEKNLKGSLFKFKIKENGQIDKTSQMVFFPAGKSKNPRESRDSGIYLSGAAPTIFKEHILFTSGNGAINKKTNNYGCSLIKLAAEKLEVRAVTSLSEEDYGECYYYNLDFSASGVAIFKNSTGDYVSIRSKDGDLRLFKFNDFQKQDRIKIGNKSYGPPIFYSKKDQTYLVSSSYSEKIIPQKKPLDILGTANQEDFLKSYGYKKGKCVGHLPTKSKNKINYLYSGKFRGHLLLVDKKSSLYNEITDLYTTFFLGKFPFNPGDRHWAKYQDLGRYLNQPDGKIDNRFELISVPYIKDIWLFKSNLNASILDNNLKYPPIQYLKLKKDNCQVDIKSFEKVYLFQKPPAENKFLNDSIKVFKISSIPKLDYEDSYQLSDLSVFHRTNFPVYKTKEGDHLYLFTFGSKKEDKIINQLGILNLKNLKLVRTFEISGMQHFSNIMIIDNKIIVPTLDGGINFLSLD